MVPRPRDANHLGRRSALQLLESPHVGISLGSMNFIKKYQFEHQGAFSKEMLEISLPPPKKS